MSADLWALIAITFLAATVNGALGYGFSSITVPVALLFYTNRILNPALVLVEAVVNLYSLIINREGIRRVWPKIAMILVGLVPTIFLGSYLLEKVQPGWIKLATYLTLLPLIFLQILGLRRPIHTHTAVGIPFGGAVGLLYSLTTISGPPIAILFNNEGLVKQDFRAALAVIRVVESLLTALAYYSLGLITLESASLLKWIVPSVVIGIPLGAALIHRLNPETFRKVCMRFDLWIVAFGLSRVLQELKILPVPAANFILLAVIGLDLALQLAKARLRPLQTAP